MWRVFSICTEVRPLPHFLVAKRYVRRRGIKTSNPPIETEAPEPVSALRSPGFHAAPETSLDKIRAEISRMRFESTKTDLARKTETQRPVLVEKALKMKTHVDDFLGKPRPSETYVKGTDVIEGVKARDRAARRRLFLDADEILRKDNKEDTLRYLQLVYNRIGSLHRSEVVEVAKALGNAVEQEVIKIQDKLIESGENKDNMELSSDEIKEMAWVNVLSEKSDEELQKLWKFGLLDFATIEALASDKMDVEESMKMKTESETHADLTTNGNTFTVEKKEEEKENVELDGDSDNVGMEHASLPIEENIEALKSMEEAQELTSCIRETVFLGVPTIDIAPIMRKVQEKEYESISETDLRKLELYEERKLELKLPHASENSTRNSSDAKNDDVYTKTESCATLNKESPNVAKTFPTKISITEAMLDRALSPSNIFLHALTRFDDSLRISFEGMERIKRLSLLDPDFQAAMEYAHSMQEVSVQPHIYNLKSENESKPHTKRQRRERRTQSASPLLGGPLARPFHSSDTPFFYGNYLSYVPPRGKYNLPAPRPSRETMAQMRKSQRRKTRARFSQ